MGVHISSANAPGGPIKVGVQLQLLRRLCVPPLAEHPLEGLPIITLFSKLHFVLVAAARGGRQVDRLVIHRACIDSEAGHVQPPCKLRRIHRDRAVNLAFPMRDQRGDVLGAGVQKLAGRPMQPLLGRPAQLKAVPAAFYRMLTPVTLLI